MIKPNRHPDSQPRAKGFTLIELIVTISIITLIASIALPSVMGIFSAGADAQAYNLLAAQLRAARALAIENSTYAGVHVQMADRPGLEDTCWSAVVVHDPDNPNNTDATFYFRPAPGFEPQRVPGSLAFGKLTTTFVQDSGGVGEYEGLGDANDFTTFTIVFSPTGRVDTDVNVAYDAGERVFDDDPNNAAYLWDAPNTEPGVWAVTMFDYVQFYARDDAGRASYLDETGQFLPVNRYTGQLFERR